MNCVEFKRQVHEFLDTRLGARQMSSMAEHLRSCSECELLVQEYGSVRRAISQKVKLPASSTAVLLRRLEKERRFVLWVWLSDAISEVSGYIRDLDKRAFWTRASALPITLCFFLVLLPYVTPSRIERLPFLVISGNNPPMVQRVLNVDVIQGREQFRGLLDTAWRLPYEDSLSLVAEIQPAGNAEIGNVLEYPKSYALLDAVDTVLKGSRFEMETDVGSPVLIYSFQKIDVYEDDTLGL